MSFCEIIDPITMEVIPPLRVITIIDTSCNNIYNFDMETLWRNYKSTGKLTNPFTTKDLSKEDQLKVTNFAKMQKIVVSIISYSYNDTLEMNSYDTIGDLVVKFLREPYFKSDNLLKEISIGVYHVVEKTTLEIDDFENRLDSLSDAGIDLITVTEVEVERSMSILNNKSFRCWLEKRKDDGIASLIYGAMIHLDGMRPIRTTSYFDDPMEINNNTYGVDYSSPHTNSPHNLDFNDAYYTIDHQTPNSEHRMQIPLGPGSSSYDSLMRMYCMDRLYHIIALMELTSYNAVLIDMSGTIQATHQALGRTTTITPTYTDTDSTLTYTGTPASTNWDVVELEYTPQDRFTCPNQQLRFNNRQPRNSNRSQLQRQSRRKDVRNKRHTYHRKH